MRTLIVVGYNNTRIYDVAKMRALARLHHDAKLVLVTESRHPMDGEAADHFIVASLADDVIPKTVETVAAEMAKAELAPIGILPFSDRGILLGAALAEYWRLPGAGQIAARAGRDKRVFRELDERAADHPRGYGIVRCRTVSSQAEFESVVQTFGGAAFVKPASEGASRGCYVINSVSECREVWDKLAPYRRDGIIVEELVQNAREYSWDYVAGRDWITEKHTTKGRYRAEIQQIVPARLDREQSEAVAAVGRHMRKLVSSENGAYHNEIFLRGPSSTSAVEVNMRPAGMCIWDLACISFTNFDPWKAWLEWAINGTHIGEILKPTNFSGIRMLQAPSSGQIEQLSDIADGARELDSKLVNFKYNVSSGDMVHSEPKDNLSFIGEVILSNDSYEQLISDLKKLDNWVKKHTSVSLITENS